MQAHKVTNSVPTTRGRTPNEEGVKSGDQSVPVK